MISALNTAFAGLQKSSTQFEKAATDIVTSTSKDVTKAEPAPNTNPTANNFQTASVPGLTQAISTEETPSLIESTVSLKEAELAYKANAKVIGALNETTDEVLKILSGE